MPGLDSIPHEQMEGWKGEETDMLIWPSLSRSSKNSGATFLIKKSMLANRNLTSYEGGPGSLLCVQKDFMFINRNICPSGVMYVNT